MAFRDWGPRRVVVLSILWIVVVLGYAAVRSAIAVRVLQRTHPDTTVLVVGHLSPWIVLGPPLLLVASWWILRRSRPR